jgi:hypothetical protein
MPGRHHWNPQKGAALAISVMGMAIVVMGMALPRRPPARRVRRIGILCPGLLLGVTVLIDMTRVQSISSRGLTIQMVTAKQLEATHSRLAVAGLRPKAREIFEISRMSNAVRVFDTVAAAFSDVR